MTKNTKRKAHSSDAPPKDENQRRAQTSSYMHAAAQIPDEKESIEAVARQASLQWTRDHGKKLVNIKHRREDINNRYAASAKEIKKLETKIANTKQHVQGFVPNSNAGGAQQALWSDWSTKDITLLILAVGGALLAMALGSANVYSSLMASGEAVFLESPALARSLSMILPLGSLALKFVTNSMDYGSTRKFYAQSIYGLTFIVLMIWVWLFSESFQGVSGQINLDALFKADSNAQGLVWSQFMAEMLSGTSLALAAESIYLKYNPSYFDESHEYTELRKARDAKEEEHKELLEQMADIDGELVQYDADRQAEINNREMEFRAYRSKLNAAQNYKF